jgi:hypothetical protein
MDKYVKEQNQKWFLTHHHSQNHLADVMFGGQFKIHESFSKGNQGIKV